MRKFLSIVLGIIVLCAAAYFFCVNNRYFFASSAEDGGDFKIGHVNICGFTAVSADTKATAQQMLQIADAHGLDVLFIQEFRPAWNFSEDDFKRLAKKYYAYISIENECAVLSRVPIISHERRMFADQSDKYSSVLLDVHGRHVRVFAPHLRTTGLNYFRYGRDITNTSNTARARGLYRENGKIRLSQAASLRDALNYSMDPVLVAGDFNSLPWSKVMRRIQKLSLRDSFLGKGRGKGATYRSMKDLARIDYILYDKNFECVDAEILPDDLSDHRMITATFRFK